MAAALLGLFKNIGPIIEGSVKGGKLGEAVGHAKELGMTAFQMKNLGDQAMGLGKAALTAINPMAMVSKGFGLIGSLGAGVVSALSPMGPLNAAFGAFSQIAGAAVESVTGLGNVVGQFVKFANPALVADFSHAVNDVMGSIGRGLIPVMTFATAVTRAFSDVLFRLSGPFQSLMKAVFDPLQAMLPQMLRSITPLLNIIGRITDSFTVMVRPLMAIVSMGADVFFTTLEIGFHALEPLFSVMALGFKMLADAMMLVIKPMADMTRRVLEFTRILFGTKDTVKGEGFGAGATNVKFGGVEDFFKDAMKAAFALGTSSTEAETPEERILHGLPDVLRPLYDLLVEIRDLLPGIKPKMPETPGEAIRNPIGTTIAVANRFVDNLEEGWERLKKWP